MTITIPTEKNGLRGKKVELQTLNVREIEVNVTLIYTVQHFFTVVCAVVRVCPDAENLCKFDAQMVLNKQRKI